MSVSCCARAGLRRTRTSSLTGVGLSSGSEPGAATEHIAHFSRGLRSCATCDFVVTSTSGVPPEVVCRLCCGEVMYALCVRVALTKYEFNSSTILILRAS